MANVSKLSNEVATVTGASKGLGAGIATALGAAGARVAVNYSSGRQGPERVATTPTFLVIRAAGGLAVAT